MNMNRPDRLDAKFGAVLGATVMVALLGTGLSVLEGARPGHDGGFAMAAAASAPALVDDVAKTLAAPLVLTAR